MALTAIAMFAFAGNSLICRLALGGGSIDAASFTSLRILAGALTLVVVSAATARGRAGPDRAGGWAPALALFAYAALFSYAYLQLSAATGALVLFGLVQATMLIAALLAGERPSRTVWSGWLIAVAGLVWLLLPGADAPSVTAAILMGMAGVAWGIYSLLGRREPDALAATTRNFLLAVIPAALLTLVAMPGLSITAPGALLALVSGAVTSGLGYVIWYAALTGLTSARAALVQLSVPAIAAAGGVLLLSEPASVRLVSSAAMILGGIGLALAGSGRWTDDTGSAGEVD